MITQQSKTNETRDKGTEGIIAQIARIRESANALIEAELRRRSIKGIVPAHGPVLLYLLKQNDPVPIKAVVEDVRRAKSTVTVMVNTLERHGYLRKLACDRDSRVTLIELTRTGLKLRKDFEEISFLLLERAYQGVSKKDRQTLVDLLAVVELNMNG